MALTGVGRRVAQHGLVLASAAVSILVAVAVLASVTGLAGAAATVGVRERLARDADLSVEVDARWSAQGLPAGDRTVRAALARAMGGAPFRTETAVRAVSAVDLQLPPAGRRQATETTLAALPVALPDPGRHAGLRSGTWPAAGSGPGLRVALPESAADRLGLDTGGTATVVDPVTGGPLLLTVTGVYRPDPEAAALWAHLGGADREAPDLLLTDPAQLTTLPAFADRTLAVWLARPDTAGLSLPDLLELRDRVAVFAGSSTARSVYRGGTPVLAETRAHSDLPAAVDRQALPALKSRAEAAVPLALLAALACLVLVLTARRLADSLAAERALRHSRGAGAARLLVASAGEWALAAVPAAVGGLLLAGSLLSVVLRASGAHAAALSDLAAADARTAWWAAGFALLVHGAALLLPLAAQLAGPARWWAARRGGSRRLGPQRAGVDLALVVVAVLGLLQLRHYNGLVARRAVAGFGAAVDPVLVLAPMATAVAGAVLTLRLFPLAGRLLERTARRSRGLVLPLGAWQLSRESGRQAVPVLATVLAVACGSLAAGVLGGLSAGDRDRAAFAVGADLRLTGVSGPVAQRQAALAALPGVTGLTPVAESRAFVGGTVVQTVAVDTAAASAHGLPLLRADQADRPAAELLAPLTAVPAAGLPVPGRPTALEVTAQAAADRPLAGAELYLWVQDARGLTERLAAPLPADGRSHVLAFPLGGAERRAHPLTVSMLGVHFPAGLTQRTTLDLRLPRIDAVGSGGSAGLALPDGHRWYRSGTAFAEPAAIGCPAAEGSVSKYSVGFPEDAWATACSWQGGGQGGELLRAVLRSQEPSDRADPATLDAVFVALPGTGATTPAPSVLPAVADRALLAALGAAVGDTVRLGWEQQSSVTQQVWITGAGRRPSRRRAHPGPPAARPALPGRRPRGPSDWNHPATAAGGCGPRTRWRPGPLPGRAASSAGWRARARWPRACGTTPSGPACAEPGCWCWRPRRCSR
ncbi:hypothetical protein GCM10020229_07780 [Kitasatospora albolonga]|uniref:hypothetical protein n=1 Tax=Kitasatospora albolonga TaxID=68173 RepID=UPI0031F09DC7